MFFLGPIGPMELILIILVLVILFGARKLPELGKSLGEGIKNFRRSIGGREKEEDKKKPTEESKASDTSNKEE